MAAVLLAVSAVAAGHQPSASAGTGASEQGLAFSLDVGGAFRLVDHNGVPRSDQDFYGRYLLVFFGYANCRSMCPVGLRRMAQAVDKLGETADAVQPVMITVDPDNDTPAVMRRELAKIQSRLLGLTGSQEALDAVYRAYRLKPEHVGTDLAGNTVISHSSYIYLMAPDGTLATLIPPILSPRRMSEIIATYIAGEG
ncbi:MAG: SCO family protein [Gammaproteobacteria bacterium]